MATRTDPYRGYNFFVEIDGLTIAGFKTCSGLEVTQKSQTYREGTDKSLNMRQIPGLTELSNITLERGFTPSRSLWDWFEKVMTGKIERKNVTIALRNDIQENKIRWDLSECWPTKWSGPSLDATSDEIAIETLELTHEGIKVNQWK